MALTATVTKTAVRQAFNKLWSITMQLELKEDAVTVLTESFSENHKQDHAIAATGARFLARMQETIDRYKKEQVVFNHADLDTVVTGVQSGLKV